MILNETVELSMLNDIYGTLLTNKQQLVLDNYLNFNISLGEIAENLMITRQAVLDTIKKASKKLENYEKKLGIMEKYLKQQELANNAFKNKIDEGVLKKIMDVWEDG